MRSHSNQKAAKYIITSLLFSTSITAANLTLAQDGESDGNRYYLERFYQQDISAAKAYLGMLGKLKEQRDEEDSEKEDEDKKITIIDVRDATEYRMGHPKKAIHMPYPRIYRECVDNLRTEDGACASSTVYQVRQDPESLFLQIEEKIEDKQTPIATLCRTGFRSVLVANIISKPTTICDLKGYTDSEYDDCVATYQDRGYANVSNIWQGFVGQPMAGIISSSGSRYVVGDDQTLTDLTLADGSMAKGFVAYDLDLNNDGAISSDDKDGWRYHQSLPYTTKMKRKLINAEADAMGYYDLP
ncbi:MAG: rhodanese-like domain-containing protein [Candidatus Thiodiazotropha taylori]|nr:rhodanese-like domain-containing protein [Candidatus Thiodiazotropha taylori]